MLLRPPDITGVRKGSITQVTVRYTGRQQPPFVNALKNSVFSDGEPDANTIKFIEDNSELKVYAYLESGIEYTGLQYGGIKVDIKSEKM
jgi:hypothetical protein